MLWVAALVAVGTVKPGAAAFALVKPSLAPFAAIGMTSRWWWAACAAQAALLAALFPLTRDWVAVVVNARTPDGILYSIQEVPLVSIGIVAWLASSRPWTETRRGAVAASTVRRSRAALLRRWRVQRG